jgi:hypothetical protein
VGICPATRRNSNNLENPAAVENGGFPGDFPSNKETASTPTGCLRTFHVPNAAAGQVPTSQVMALRSNATNTTVSQAPRKVGGVVSVGSKGRAARIAGS